MLTRPVAILWTNLLTVPQENVKDAINFIMSKHESDMRNLAKTAYGAQTYQGFVSRWEINKEPPPAEEKRPSYVSLQSHSR